MRSRDISAELKAGRWQAAVGARQSLYPAVPKSSEKCRVNMPGRFHYSIPRLPSYSVIPRGRVNIDGWIDMHSSKRTLLPASKAGNHGQKHSHYNNKKRFYPFFPKQEKSVSTFSSKKNYSADNCTHRKGDFECFTKLSNQQHRNASREFAQEKNERQNVSVSVSYTRS